MVDPPHGRAAVIETFGNIARYVRTDGTLSPKWEEEMIRRVTLPHPLLLTGTQIKVTRITCHRLVTHVLRETLRAIDEAGKWSKLNPYGGGFIFRPKRTADDISLHAWGIAWDFDPDHNKLGTSGTMDPTVVQIFTSRGFRWGGDFQGTKDPMHFQYATGV